jgi:hypothetical protein
MRVRLLTDRAGNTFVQYTGDIIDLPEREAMRLVALGQAEIIEPETAAMTGGHTAVLPRPKLHLRGQRK